MSCSGERLRGYTFPKTEVKKIAQSDEQCRKNESLNASASIRCKEFQGTFKFDPDTFNEVSCNETVFNITLSADKATQSSIQASVQNLRTLITRETELPEENADHAVQVTVNVSEALTKHRFVISENLFADVVNTISRVTEKKFLNQSKIELVKTMENIISHVEPDENQDVPTFPSPYIFAQIIKVDFDTEENITFPTSENKSTSIGVSVTIPLQGIDSQLSSPDIPTTNRHAEVYTACQSHQAEEIIVKCLSQGHNAHKQRKRSNFGENQVQNISRQELNTLQRRFFKFITFLQDVLPPPTGLADPIITIRIGSGKRIKLISPLIIEFRNKSQNYGENETRQPNDTRVVTAINYIKLKCAFFNFQSKKWDHDGVCLEIPPNHSPRCISTHLTSFALLMSDSILPSNVALNIFSDVGCAITLVSLIIAIVLTFANTKMRSRLPSQIQLHLFCNMFMAYTILLTGIEQVSIPLACSTITVALQYTFLTTFFWIAVYCNRIYYSLIRVFEQTSDNYMWKATLFAYGVPGLIILTNVTLSITYFDKRIFNPFCDKSRFSKLRMSTYFSRNMCWVNQPSLYFSFLLVIGFILAYNVFVIIAIAKNVVFKKKKIRSTASQKSLFQQVTMIISLSLSLGISWVFGYLLLIDYNVVYQTIFGWVFSVLTSSQGLVLLYLSCIKNQEMFNFWYLPLRKIFLHPKSSRIPEFFTPSSDQTSCPSNSFGFKDRGKLMSSKTETTFL